MSSSYNVFYYTVFTVHPEEPFKDIELNGVSFIDARLVYDPDQQGKKKKWMINVS